MIFITADLPMNPQAQLNVRSYGNSENDFMQQFVSHHNVLELKLWYGGSLKRLCIGFLKSILTMKLCLTKNPAENMF